MRLNREHSPFCGNGGGVPATLPEIAPGAGENAGAMILETGADILVTSCPSCQQSLEQHIPGMEVLDLNAISTDSVVLTHPELGPAYPAKHAEHAGRSVKAGRSHY